MKSSIKAATVCRIGNKVYFSNLAFNGILYLDLKDFSIHLEHRFTMLDSSIRGGSVYCMHNAKVVYFFPSKYNFIIAYDIENKQERKILMPDFEEDIFSCEGFVRKENRVYLYTNKSGGQIYLFDLQDEKVEKVNFLCEEDIFFPSLCHGNNMEGMLGRCNGQWCWIDPDEKRKIYSKSISKDTEIRMIYYQKNNYWLLLKEKTDIYKWNKETDRIQIYHNENIEWAVPGVETVPYSNLIFLKDDCLVLNFHMKYLLQLNHETKKIERPLQYPASFQLVDAKFNGWPIYSSYVLFEEKVLIFPCYGNMLLIYDKQTKALSGKEFSVSEDEVFYLEEVLDERLRDEDGIVESGELETLEEYIDYLFIKSADKKCVNSKSAGEAIYRGC